MQVRSNLKSGQEATQNSNTPQDVVKRVVDTMQGDVKDLNIWSIIRVKNQGLSSWMVLSQKTPKVQAAQP